MSRPGERWTMLVLEPTGEAALPSPAGVRLLGIEATTRVSFPAMRHVFDLGDDAGLHVEVDLLGHVNAFAVSYDMESLDEILTPL